jgi:hypothetical protein
VPETINALRAAGIKVWVLTGDKQEITINIGYASQQHTQEKTNVVQNGVEKEGVKSKFQHLDWMFEYSADNTETDKKRVTTQAKSVNTPQSLSFRQPLRILHSSNKNDYLIFQAGQSTSKPAQPPRPKSEEKGLPGPFSSHR